MSHRRPELLALTGLRGLAGLLMVLASVRLWPDSPDGLRQLLGLAGPCASAFFFLLSGFVLAVNYPGLWYGAGRRTLGRYAAARVARIVPLFVLVGAVVLLLGRLNGDDWVRAVYADQTWFVGTLVLCYAGFPLLARPIAMAPGVAAGCLAGAVAVLLVVRSTTELSVGRLPVLWPAVFAVGIVLAALAERSTGPAWPDRLSSAPGLTHPLLVRLGVIGYPLFLLSPLVLHGFGRLPDGDLAGVVLALGWSAVAVLTAEGTHRYAGAPGRRAVLALARRIDTTKGGP